MPFYPFHSTFTELRTLELPANLAADARGRLVAKITAAVRQQAELAQKCDGLLRLTGEVREDGNYLLIPHEPAAPADPELIASRDDHPDIQTLWWLTWATLRALGAATADRAPHGSIQLGSLFMDQAGRVKLSDLGIGPAFESACGIDARRYVACDAHVETDAAGRASSGRWMVLSEEDARDHGWIAPFFAHELLEGQVRLNPKSDQFALGTLLFLCATGEHPYGAALSDPGLMFYFHIEPFALDDERAEWRESFKRKSKGLAQSSDRPVLAWAELVHKLLAAEPGERFASPAEASEFIQEHVPEEWAAASKAIDEANAALDGGDPDAFLDKLTPWPTHEALPEMWRTQLAARVEEVRAQKDVIGQQKLLARSLTEAQEALNDLNLDEARRVAQEILAAAHCPDTLRREADEIVKHCDEREKFVESGTDELAQHYLSAAREALQASEFNDARQYCEVILKDPGMSQTRTAQARQFIGEVELAEQRVKAQFDELEQATNELRKGHCEPAQERLEALLGDQSLPEAVATQVRLVLEDARRTLALRQEYTQALDDAQEAWQRGDLEVLRTRLESVPEDLSDAQISERRTTLLASAECLQTARQLQEEAHAAVDAGRCQAALATIEQAGAAGELPTVVREELAALQQRCREGLEQELRAARERAQTALQEARARYEAEDGVGCRKLLEQTVLPTEGLPDEARAEATALREACQLLEQAAAAAAEIEQHLARANVGRALALLRDLQTDGLPARLVTRLGQQRERAEHVRQQVEQAQRAQLDQRLKQAAAVIQKGQLGQAEAILAEVEAANGVSAEQRERASAMRAEVAKYRPLAETLAKAESVLAEAADTKRALALLERLPVEPPAWARPRADAIRQRATELEEQQRRETIARAAAALDATQSALEAGDAETARQRLDQTSAGIALEPSLTERRAALATALATLEQWLPKVAELDAAYQRSETARVYRDASTLLKDKSVPELVAKRLGTLQTAARKQIEARRKELAAELETLATELEQRGRRARQFEQRVELVRGDSLAAKDQISTADELRQRFAALPVPKSKAMPIGVAAAIVVVVGGAAAWFLTRNDDGHQPGPTIPTVVQDHRERMTAALASLQNRVDEAATELGAAAPRYTLRFEPADKLPAELLAQNTADGTDMSLGTIAVSDLASLSLTAAWHSQLFPPPPDTAHADDGARMGPVLARLQAAVNAAAAQAGPAAPSYTLRFDPADMLPARLIAQNAMDGTDLLLETVSAETLDTLGVSDAWRAQLFGPP
ncbi:MAG: hypothetical protein KKB50_13930, partial [Planctomycetes bacterium]|nr:hypothetical protein [Planctomycetota bacterium]